MRPKYVVERFPRYMIFGENKDGTTVDVSNGEDDVVTLVKRSEAEKLIAERDAVIDALCAMAMAFDEADHDALTRHWWPNEKL